MTLFSELKRRQVFGTAAIYVAIAWGATEIVITIEDKFGLPEWISQVAIIAFVVGFPVTLLASWYVDLTAKGFRAETPGRPLGASSIGVLAGISIAATYLLWVLISPGEHLEAACPATDPFCADASLAVLPFDNLAGDTLNDHLASGLAVDLAAVIGRLEGVRVASNRSSAIAVSRGLSDSEIGEALEVEHLVTGTFRPGADGPVLVVQLIDATDQVPVWSESFELDLGIIAARQAITDALTGLLDLGQTGTSSPTADAEAFGAYLRGLQLERIEDYGTDSPLQHFATAVQLDPEFADAHVGLARTYIRMGNSGLIGEQDMMAKALAATERALQLNPRLPQAYALLGLVYRRAGRIEDAFNALSQALELNPSDNLVHLEMARLLRNQGFLEAANREMEIAYQLDPLDEFVESYRAEVLALRGDHALAIRILETALAANPDSDYLLGNMQILALLGGAPEASLEFAQRSWESGVASEWTSAFESLAYSRLGQAESAWRAVRRAEDTNSGNYWVEIARLMRLAADGDGPGLRVFAESLSGKRGSDDRNVNKWAGLGALMQGDHMAAAAFLETAFDDLAWYSGNFPAEEIVHMLNLVAAYRALGNTDKAEEWLELSATRIAGLRAQDIVLPDLDYAEGALLVLQGKPDQGQQLLERARLRGWLGWPIMQHDPKLVGLGIEPR